MSVYQQRAGNDASILTMDFLAAGATKKLLRRVPLVFLAMRTTERDGLIQREETPIIERHQVVIHGGV